MSRRPVLLAVAMFLQYALVCYNLRVIAQGRYLPAMASDALIAFNGWTLTRWVTEARTWQERAGYIFGASLGSALGIWVTR